MLARGLTNSRTVIGALLGAEGFVALLFPIWVGAVSDRVHTRLGSRLPFLIGTAPFAALSLALLPFGRSLPVLAVGVFCFYLAYFAYYAPYRALYTDLVPREESGRSQGIQGVFRGAGTGAALIGGSLLLPLWQPLPYFIGSAALIATTLVLVLGLRNGVPRNAGGKPRESVAAEVWSLLREHPDIRWFMLANLLWQVTESGLKTFIILFLNRGLHKSFAFSAGAMIVVAAAALVSAPIAGRLADRFGLAKVMQILLVLFGVGLWLPALPAFLRSTVALLSDLPIVGMGGAMALSLPYAMLMQITPKESHGATAGLFDVSSGAGQLLGPLVTGAAIDVMHPWFQSTEGYGAMWPVIGTATLLSVPLVARSTRLRGDSQRTGHHGVREAGVPSRERSSPKTSST